ncbi:MAG: ABC transporter substrate-binding protein [Candidatus Hydrogenedentes bacterium]|nr:ABC transporter substrate-binding protein [Candidatus Hydrogenedentota bacterium]
MTPLRGFICIAALTGILAGCGNPASESGRGGASPRVFKPIDETAVLFWDRQTLETADLITRIAGEYNAQHGGLPVKVEHLGDYSDINRKLSVSIQARELPAMAVGYDSMTAEYVQAGAAVPLDEYMNDAEVGLTNEDRADFFPGVLATSTNPAFGGKTYSFPFTKSVLVMYFNKKVLRAAGIEAPPKTWDEFLAQCRLIKDKTGQFGYAVDVDCSTIDGMIYSRGGELVRGAESLFDQPASVAVFEYLETLAKEKLAFQIQPGTFDDRDEFTQGRVAFFFRTSSLRPYVAAMMAQDPDGWGIAMIPQAHLEAPATVLYGGNIGIFQTTPEQQRIAWGFIKYFTSPEVSARWALGSGYLPLRKSAADHPDMQAFFKQWEYNRAAFDCLPHARPEPNLAGWQEVRTLVERAGSQVMSGLKTGRQAAMDLKQEADRVLAAAQ